MKKEAGQSIKDILGFLSSMLGADWHTYFGSGPTVGRLVALCLGAVM